MSGILSAAIRNRQGKLLIISYTEKQVTRRLVLWIGALTIAAPALPLVVVHAQVKEEASATKTDATKPEQFKPEQQPSKGSVTVSGTVINYDAFAGTLVVHPKGWDDVPQNADKDDKSQPAEASMFYVASFKSADGGSDDSKGEVKKGDKKSGTRKDDDKKSDDKKADEKQWEQTDTQRPVTFLYNGGPRSFTALLRTGPFRARRV